MTKDAENEKLKKDAERYRKLRRMLSPDSPDRFDKNVDDADEGSVRTEYYDSNYVARPELAKLLVHPLIETANKDAERYRKLKAEAEILKDQREGKTFLHFQIVILFVETESIDEIVDALPEVMES